MDSRSTSTLSGSASCWSIQATGQLHRIRPLPVARIPGGIWPQENDCRSRGKSCSPRRWGSTEPQRQGRTVMLQWTSRAHFRLFHDSSVQNFHGDRPGDVGEGFDSGLAGAVGGIATASAVPESVLPWCAARSSRDLALIIIGLLGELLPTGSPIRLRDLRAADGRVDIAPLRGARGEPNPADPRFTSIPRALMTPRLSSALDVPLPPASMLSEPIPLLGRCVVIVSLFVGHDGRAVVGPGNRRGHPGLDPGRGMAGSRGRRDLGCSG